MKNIFFTSDTHFYHTNIIKYCNRPFSSVEEMNQKLIENWNNTISEHDTIFHLGDFMFKKKLGRNTFSIKWTYSSYIRKS
jgi:calcineurin-like phosphoesterase family protein